MPDQSTPVSPRVAANDFARQWLDIGRDAIEAIDGVGRSGWLVLGEEVRSFEQELAEWWGVPHAVGVASGLDALEIGLRCAGIQPGDRVLTTPLTAFATTLAIIRAGGEPVWCDVDPSGCLDLDVAEAALSADPAIRMVVPVHLYGHPLDPDRLERMAAEHEVVVIEDCAQSAGAERAGRPTGLAGRAAATSLYPTKNLGALGDGGVLLTADAALATRARALRDYGQAARYEHAELGLNSRLDELHAAVLRSAMLPRLDRWLGRRERIAARYSDAFADSPLAPIRPLGGRSANHLFPVEVRGLEPAIVAQTLAGQGIAVGRHYPFLCHEQPAARGRGTVIGTLSVARGLADRELSLPIHPYLTDDEIARVIQGCLEACA
ncbi:MAG: DegT/DnrJ/EryC1/StrS family aminotransferase [Solirubrobacteraceae bacterium]